MDSKIQKKLLRGLFISLTFSLMPILLFSVIQTSVQYQNTLKQTYQTAEKEISFASEGMQSLCQSIINGYYNQLILSQGMVINKINFEDPYVTKLISAMSLLMDGNKAIETIYVINTEIGKAIVSKYGRVSLSELPQNIQNIIYIKHNIYCSDIWTNATGNSLFSISVKEDMTYYSTRSVIYNISLSRLTELFELNNSNPDFKHIRFYFSDRYNVPEEYLQAASDAKKEGFVHVSSCFVGGIYISGVIDKKAILYDVVLSFVPVFAILLTCIFISIIIVVLSVYPIIWKESNSLRRDGPFIGNVVHKMLNDNKSNEKMIAEIVKALKKAQISAVIKDDVSLSQTDFIVAGMFYLCSYTLLFDYPFQKYYDEVVNTLDPLKAKVTDLLSFQNKSMRTVFVLATFDDEANKAELLPLLENGGTHVNSSFLYQYGKMPVGFKSAYENLLSEIRHNEIRGIESKKCYDGQKYYNQLLTAFQLDVQAAEDILRSMLSDTEQNSRRTLKINTINILILIFNLYRKYDINVNNSFYYLFELALLNCDNFLYNENIELISSLANQLFSEKPLDETQMSYKKYAEEILAYIELNYDKSIGLDDAASKFNITKQYLCNIIRHTFDTTFITLLNDHRIKIAGKLLNTTNMTVDEIAKATGFNSSSYFINHFKNKIGLTPGEYRKKDEI